MQRGERFLNNADHFRNVMEADVWEFIHEQQSGRCHISVGRSLFGSRRLVALRRQVVSAGGVSYQTTTMCDDPFPRPHRSTTLTVR